MFCKDLNSIGSRKSYFYMVSYSLVMMLIKWAALHEFTNTVYRLVF